MRITNRSALLLALAPSLLLLLCLNSSAYSNGIEEKQDQSARQDEGTNVSESQAVPVTVPSTVGASPQAKPDSPLDGTKEHDKTDQDKFSLFSNLKITDIVNAVATAFIACFTWALIRVGTKQANASLIAANAAKTSADVARKTLIHLDGPYLEVSIKADAVTYKTPFPMRVRFVLDVKNVGKASATVKVLWYRIGEEGDDSLEQMKGERTAAVYRGGIVHPGGTFSLGTYESTKILDRAAFDQAIAQGDDPAFYGIVSCEDRFGSTHRIGLGWIYSLSENNLRWAGKQHNYYKIDEADESR